MVSYVGAIPDRVTNYGEILTSGNVASMQDRRSLTSLGLVSGVVNWTLFRAPTTMAVSRLRYYVAATVAAPTPTLVRFGLYSVASNNDLNQIGVTANNVNLFSAGGASTEPLLTPSSISLDAWYAVAVLVISGAAMPALVASPANNSNTVWGQGPRLTGVLTGQADLPVSIPAASIVNSNTYHYAELLAA